MRLSGRSRSARARSADDVRSDLASEGRPRRGRPSFPTRETMRARKIKDRMTRIMALDLGTVRTGVALSDPTHTIATPSNHPAKGAEATGFVDQIRDMAEADAVERIIVGTAAVESPDLVRQMCGSLGPTSVVVGLDARDGYVAVEGWTRGSRVRASELATRMAEAGAVRFMYTDVARDGTLTEPNFQAVDTLLRQVRGSLMVAGGISSQEHLLRLSRQGVEAAIVGQALYTGAIDLCDTLAVLERSP